MERCEHLERIEAGEREAVRPSGHGCEECLRTGDPWVHLRLCLTCGHVGCCDDSPNRHATAHFHATGHSVIKSFEPGEDWAWCYLDETTVAEVPVFPGERAPRHYAPPR